MQIKSIVSGLFFCIHCMLLSSVSAQEQEANRIVWSELSQLPPSETGKHLGVAGAFAGVHHDVLIIAGGANFSSGMPWEGGKKVYNDAIYVLQKSGGSSQWIT